MADFDDDNLSYRSYESSHEPIHKHYLDKSVLSYFEVEEEEREESPCHK